jgi:hypothetical protein
MMMSSKILALSGEQEVGKDTFAEPLIKRGFIQGSFAKNLKDMCIQIFDLSDFLVNHPEGKRTRFRVPRDFTSKRYRQIIKWMAKTHDISDFGLAITETERELIHRPVRETGKPRKFHTAREILQFVGTDVIRRIFPDYHMDVLRMKLESTPGNWVITDARFENERAMLQEVFGATLIRIKRPGFTPPDQLGSVTERVELVTTKHISEVSLGSDDDYDYVIVNSGTIEELHKESLRFV